MTMPIGAIVGSIAATCGHHNHNEARDEYNAKYYEDLEELNKKRDLILDYLKKTFKADKVTIDEKTDFNITIYYLNFRNMVIGIKLENDMIINTNVECSYRYSYDLVFKELIKITKQKYIK